MIGLYSFVVAITGLFKEKRIFFLFYYKISLSGNYNIYAEKKDQAYEGEQFMYLEQYLQLV